MATQIPFDFDPSTHTMRHSLADYIAAKIHPDIESKMWSRIVVKGLNQRTGAAHIFPHEKTDKLFNWHRPTTIVNDNSTLVVACFPGRDYVQHYYWLITLHLLLAGKDHTVVEIDLPVDTACLDIFLESNLRAMGKVHTVIFGYAQQTADDGVGWENGAVGDNQLFSWQKVQTPDGRDVAYLGCLVSFWGDISGQLVRALQLLNAVRCVIYIGKAGSLHAEDYPNQVIATNGSSFMKGELVSWKNVLSNALKEVNFPTVRHGVHVNVVSPLEESFTWLAEWRGRADCVDCEVGYIARACLEQQTSFGYLHIISDNVTEFYSENLAHERDINVTKPRTELFSQVLKRLLEGVAREKSLDEPPRACEIFDLIGGTSTGGLFAIMLGRLRMTINECIDAYMEIADSVFIERTSHTTWERGQIQKKFSSSQLD